MPQIVELPGNRTVEFPDDFTPDQMNAEIMKAFPELRTQATMDTVSKGLPGTATFGAAMAKQELPKAGVPAVTVPVVGEEGTFARGVSKAVSGLVESATTPEGIALLGVGGIGKAAAQTVGMLMTGAAVKETAAKAGEFSVTGSPETAGEAAVMGVAAALTGAATVGSGIKARRDFIASKAPATAGALERTVAETKPAEVEPAKPTYKVYHGSPKEVSGEFLANKADDFPLRGVSVSTESSVANRYALDLDLRKGGAESPTVYSLELTGRVVDVTDLRAQWEKTGKPWEDAYTNEITEFAKSKGYDAIDLASAGMGEPGELFVINPKALKRPTEAKPTEPVAKQPEPALETARDPLIKNNPEIENAILDAISEGGMVQGIKEGGDKSGHYVVIPPEDIQDSWMFLKFSN